MQEPSFHSQRQDLRLCHHLPKSLDMRSARSQGLGDSLGMALGTSVLPFLSGDDPPSGGEQTQENTWHSLGWRGCPGALACIIPNGACW